MKKTLTYYTIFMLFLSHSLFAQCLKDSIHYYSNIEGSSIKTLYAKTINKYNKQKNKIESTYYTIRNNAFEINTRNSYSYNSNKLLEIELIESRNDITDTIEYDIRKIYTYDANNLIDNILTQKFTNGIWTNSTRTIYTYGANNRESSLLIQLYNTQSNQYENASKQIFTYHPTLDTLITYTQQLWENNTWINYSSIEREYNASNKLIKQIIRGPYDMNLTHIYELIYNNNKLIATNVYEENSPTISYTDSTLYNGNLAYGFIRYNNQNNNYIPWGALEYTIQGNDTLGSIQYSNWDTLLNRFIKFYQSENFCRNATDVNEVLPTANEIQIYPNPTTAEINIIVPQKIDAIIVSNIIGKQIAIIAPQKNANVTTIDVKDWADGLYIISLKMTDGNIYQHKILKQ
jgi:hypothetical protein